MGVNRWRLKSRNDHLPPIEDRERWIEQTTTSQKWVTAGENWVGGDGLVEVDFTWENLRGVEG